MSLSVTEANKLNRFLKWYFKDPGFTGPVPESEALAAMQDLADAASHRLGAGYNGLAVNRLWTEKRPVVYVKGDGPRKPADDPIVEALRASEAGKKGAPMREREGVRERVVFSAHHTRYFLTNGLFIDRSSYEGPWKYGVYLPGGHPSGCACRVDVAGTLKAAVAKAFAAKPLPRNDLLMFP